MLVNIYDTGQSSLFDRKPTNTEKFSSSQKVQTAGRIVPTGGAFNQPSWASCPEILWYWSNGQKEKIPFKTGMIDLTQSAKIMCTIEFVDQFCISVVVRCFCSPFQWDVNKFLKVKLGPVLKVLLCLWWMMMEKWDEYILHGYNQSVFYWFRCWIVFEFHGGLTWTSSLHLKAPFYPFCTTSSGSGIKLCWHSKSAESLKIWETLNWMGNHQLSVKSQILVRFGVFSVRNLQNSCESLGLANITISLQISAAIKVWHWFWHKTHSVRMSKEHKKPWMMFFCHHVAEDCSCSNLTES